MQILSAQQLRQCDEFTIAEQHITSLDLMERAAKACIPSILKLTDPHSEFVVFCGKGNNGGDGLAISRLLLRQNYKVRTIIVEHSEKISDDAAKNLEALNNTPHASVMHVHRIEDLEDAKLSDNQAFMQALVGASDDLAGLKTAERTIIIDALLGIGVNRPVEGLLAEVIDLINALQHTVIAIDLPSGLYANRSSKDNKHIVKATKTLTFHCLKLALLMAENAAYTGHTDVLDIGLDKPFAASLETPYTLLQKQHIRFLLKPRPLFSHKGIYGHALLIGGSKGKSGAAILAAKACLKSGAGLLTVHSCQETLSALLIQLPEAMASFDVEDHISSYPHKTAFSAIGIGPGLGTDKDTQNVLKLLIQEATVPLVFDADAINILSENKTWLAFTQPGCVFTPHIKEFDRLAGAHQSDFDRLETAIAFSAKHRQTIVLKGTYTAVVLPSGKVYFNSTGNPALAKGGSGDVLTGIITGLIARGYEPEQACVIGVYVHGYAGDLCIKKQSQESVLASEVIAQLGKAFRKIGA